MSKKINDHQKQKIIEKYKNKIPIKNISKEFLISDRTVHDIIKKAGIETKTKNVNSFSEEEINNIINLYKEKKSSEFIAAKFSCSVYLILKIIKKFSNISTERGSRVRKYSINENFFDTIDTEEKAYFLGLLYSDGCNRKTSIYINLKAEDRYILQKFSYLIFGFDNTKFIKRKKDHYSDQYSLSISSKYMCERLSKIGCFPAKSLTLEFPDWLKDAELQRHFLRGYFDGDGSLKFSKENKFIWKITSTMKFCQSVHEILKEQNINSQFYQNKEYLARGNNITTSLSSGGNYQVFKLCGWMYKDATIYLERKYEKYLLLKNKICKYH